MGIYKAAVVLLKVAAYMIWCILDAAQSAVPEIS